MSRDPKLIAMAEIVNLRRARKARKRLEKENQAAANRRSFGRRKDERVAERAEKDRQTRNLDGKRLD